MDLLCCESTTVSVAKRDPALLLDDRVFEHMLQYETRFLPKANYLVEVQTDFNSKQRKILVDWMWEVLLLSVLLYRVYYYYYLSLVYACTPRDARIPGQVYTYCLLTLYDDDDNKNKRILSSFSVIYVRIRPY